MDVDQVQKVNNLAVDLLNQGLAKDREEAVGQAEKILQDRSGTDEYSQIRENLVEEKPVEQHLSQDQIKEILEKNTTFLVAKIKEFHDKVTSLENEIADLKEQVKTPTVREIVSQVEEPKQDVQAELNSEATPATKQATTENHPRSGSYVDSDVSIEKFFYMGNK